MGQTEFFVILDHFWHFYNPNNPKSQHWKNQKTTWRYYHFTHEQHKWQSYHVWSLRYGVWQTEFFVILDRFLPFYPTNNAKNQNFEKMKKPPGDIIILHICTINDNYMMYGSWHMKHHRENLSFWTVFCRFTPLITQKIKILKNWKNAWRYHQFKQVYQKSWSYATEIWCITDVIVIFHSVLSFALLPP